MPIEIELNKYAELGQFFQGFHDDSFNLLGVVGRCGTGKSEMARRVIGDDAVYLEGNGSAFGIFGWAQENKNRMLVLDDLDHLYKDRVAVRVLRALTDSRDVRTVRWESNALRRDGDGGGLKRVFTTSSPVCIISNLWRRLNANGDALADRGFTIRFDPSNDELHRYVGTWFQDDEVYHFIGRHLRVASPISIRDYINTGKLRKSGMDWKNVLQRMWKLDPKLALAAELLARNISPAERLQAFLSHPQGGSRATYFRKTKELGVTNETLENDETVRLTVSQSHGNNGAAIEET